MTELLHSLTPGQLSALVVSLTDLVFWAALLGGLLGANLQGAFEFFISLFARTSSALFGSRRPAAEAIRDMQRERRILLLRARVLKREALKLSERSSGAAHV